MAGISDSTGHGVIENTELETSGGTEYLRSTIPPTIPSMGGLCDTSYTGNGTLALVKGGSGTLTLSGAHSGGYTGGLTVNAGTLDLSNGVLPDCTITINGGTLIYPSGGFAAMAAASSEGLTRRSKAVDYQ